MQDQLFRLFDAFGPPETFFRRLPLYRIDPDEFTQVTLSGGGSSAYQAWHLIEAAGGLPDRWKLVFCNTGFERPETLDFIADFSRNVGVPVTWLEREAAGGFSEVGHNSAARNGEPFKLLVTEEIKRVDGTIGKRPLPSDGPRRLCSGELKTKTAHRYLRSLGWGRYASAIGFRADEEGRVRRKRRMDAKRPRGVVEGGYGVFPMAQAGVRADDVFAFGAQVPWWLRLPSWKGNCNNCFMMSEWKMKERLVDDPHSADPWIEMEEMPRDRNSFFRPGRKTMRQLRDEVLAGDFSVDPKALKARPECGTCHD